MIIKLIAIIADIFEPYTIGNVLAPSNLSPSISSMSFCYFSGSSHY